MTPRRTTSPVTVIVAVAVALVLAAALTGCNAGDPRTIGPSGVDGLEVPSPSPDAADFVEGIDNPWLPLRQGSRWRYRMGGAGATGTLTVSVTDEVREVAGVSVTVVREVVRDADRETVRVSDGWFAQDAAGNVWQLGEEVASYDGPRMSADGSWEAGEAGAQAGLAMPAVPRVGDGFEQEYAPGVAEDRARVLRIDAEVRGPAGSWTAVVHTENSTPREPGVVSHAYYARDVGLVREEMVTGGTEVAELVARSTAGSR